MTRRHLIFAMMAAFTTGCAVLPEHEFASVSCCIKQVALCDPDAFSALPGDYTLACLFHFSESHLFQRMLQHAFM